MKDTKEIYKIVIKNTEIGHEIIGEGKLKIWIKFEGKLQELIRESSKTLENLFHQDEWYEFGESLGVRCDDNVYFLPANPVARWLNFDMIYDAQYSEGAVLEEEIELWLERVEKFKKWWDKKGSYIFAEILSIENRKDVEVLKMRHLLDEYESGADIENIEIKLPAFMAIGGRIYKLRFEERAENNLAEAIKSEVEMYKKALKGIIERREKAIANKIKEILERLEESIAEVPEWMTSTQKIIKHKISIVRHGTMVFILFPIKYNPKYVKREGVVYRIKNPDKLKRNVIAKVRYTNGRLSPPLSLRYDNGERFYHYHTTDIDEDCTGSLEFPQVTSFEQLIEFKERVEKSLELINVDDIARREPENMPHVDDIEVERKEEIGWKA